MSVVRQPLAKGGGIEIDPTRILAVAFDMGGVLIDSGPREVREFGKHTGLDDKTWIGLIAGLFGTDSRWAALERGEISFEEFALDLAAQIRKQGGEITDEQARTFMGGGNRKGARPVLRTKLLEAIRSARTRVPTALLTNNVREWRESWKRHFDDPNLFDVVVDSSAVGTRKPEPKIYEITRERLGVDHEAIFFVDDIGQNLKAARALGWQTLLYTNEDEVVDILDRVPSTRRGTI